jgi:hypothetical protein
MLREVARQGTLQSKEEIKPEGSISTVNIKKMHSRVAGRYTFTLTNSNGDESDKVFVIGDAVGVLEQVRGASYDDPAIKGDLNIASFKKIVENNSLELTGLKIVAKTSEDSFANPIEISKVDFDGEVQTQKVDLIGTLMNNVQNPKIRDLKFDEPMIFDRFNGFVITVPDGETLTVQLIVRNIHNVLVK